MKALSLFLAAVGGAGFLFRGQLQSLVNSSRQGTEDIAHHLAPEGVYYLRSAYTFVGSQGTVRWAPGQELRSVAHAANGEDSVTLTDGVNVAQVSQTAVTRDMDDAAALRQMEASSQNAARAQSEQVLALRQAAARQTTDPNRIVSGQFRGTDLDAPAARTNRAENIVSTASAPVMYPVYRTVVVSQPTRQVNERVIVDRRSTPPASTPAGRQA